MSMMEKLECNDMLCMRNNMPYLFLVPTFGMAGFTGFDTHSRLVGKVRLLTFRK